MAKLVVEVLDASDLMPKDGQGSANPFVELEFDDQKQRTQTKFKDLNPQWNEKLVFDVRNDHGDLLQNRTVVVSVYHDKKVGGGGGGGHHKNFLGRVRISGASVPLSDSEASVQRYPLEERGLFSHIKGDLALRIHVSLAPNLAAPTTNFAAPPVSSHNSGDFAQTTVKENSREEEVNRNLVFYHDDHQKQETTHLPKKKNEEKEVRTFHSIGAGTAGPAAPPPEMLKPTVSRSDFARAGPMPNATMQQQHMQFPRQNPEYGLVETRPPLAARMRYIGGDKMSSTYDLVEKMQYLYVNVVKARDLPTMDITGSLDPYVELKLGNYKAITKHFEKNQNPVWNKIFAFSKERLQSNFLEVIVKDKDFVKDDFVGKVVVDVSEVPVRVPPDSPLAPEWYRLVNNKGEKTAQGEIMLAVWMGTQADESFPEAWHSDAHSISHEILTNTRSKVYFSPKLYYLRVHVLEAQDLVPSEKGRAPETYVKMQLGNQVRVSRPSQMRTIHPTWNEELMFVASEPFDEYLVISVDDRIGPGKDEILGRLMIPVREIPLRVDVKKPPDARWFNLHRLPIPEEEEQKRKEKFSSKIHLRLCMEAGYHVLDEATHFSSDFQPSSKYLRKQGIGLLELGILSARNLLPMKAKDGRTTDAYCVAKYGNKWVRTRTLLNTLAPSWNEQYTWEVYDPCTVITIGVFDNSHVNGSKEEAKDQRIGKVRIRLSTLETDRVYTHYYPLLGFQNSGLKKHGELQLALRFTCTAWVNMVTLYGMPMLPKMHYVQPISVRHIDWLRQHAMQIVAARLARSEPPLRRETVEYMLDVDYHMWSLRRSKANFLRIMSLLSGITAVSRWFNGICHWKNPITTCLVCFLFFILVSHPELILPTTFLYLFMIGLWNYRFRQRLPPYMDARLSQAEMAHPDELDEEFDTFPTSRPSDMVRMRYDRLRSVAGKVQSVVGDLATQGERTLSILSWRDPRATAIVIIFSLILAVFLYITPFQVVAVIYGVYMLRHPRFRSKMPSVPVNFFKRLPAKSDMML